MFCKNCGSEYPYGENICPGCGQVRALQGEELEAYNKERISQIKIEMEEARAEYEKKYSSRAEENRKLEQELAELKKRYKQETERKKMLKVRPKQQFICNNCGAENENGVFCSKCGTKLR